MRFCGLKFEVVFLVLMFIALPNLWAGEGVRQLKEEEEKATSISVDKAREMMAYEEYLLEKQESQERLRGVSKTASWLKDLREGQSRKGKQKEDPSKLQKKFLKEKLKNPEENRQKLVQENTSEEEEKKKALERKKNLEFSRLSTLKLRLEEEEKNQFYQLKFLQDQTYRDELVRKRKKTFQEEYRGGKEVGSRTTTEQILDDVPFLRELTLSPYAFESQDWER